LLLQLVEGLLQIKKDKSGLMRRNNLFKDIDMVLKIIEASAKSDFYYTTRKLAISFTESKYD